MTQHNEHDMRRPFAVRRGRVWTRFTHAAEAWRYWRETLGGVLMIWTAQGWRRV
jgi:hypothetical protein